ncbi:MAG: hypothetical protein II412_04985 [Clostridia bacterium]|nr:hypothetical protein [Clostridia bacterium]
MNAAAEKLKASIREGRAMHGYIITGGDETVTEKLMLECAALLIFGNEDTDRLANSPDFALLDGSIKVDEVRDIRLEVNKTTYSSINRVFLIRNAHLMNASSINAMLKVLEEPPEGTYFFLSGIEPRIIPTIRSRCMIVRLGEGDPAEVQLALEALGASAADARRYTAYACASLDTAKRLYEDESFRELHSGAIEALIALLNKELPFSFFKKIEKDRTAAMNSVEFMLAACYDLIALRSSTGCGVSLCASDFESELRLAANSIGFTVICEVAAKLTEACERLTSNASSGQILDRLAVDVNAVVTRRK